MALLHIVLRYQEVWDKVTYYLHFYLTGAKGHVKEVEKTSNMNLIRGFDINKEIAIEDLSLHGTLIDVMLLKKDVMYCSAFEEVSCLMASRTDRQLENEATLSNLLLS